MLHHINVENVLFIDIETVPQYPAYADVPQELQKFWDIKANRLASDEQTPEEIYDMAGIYAEFGRIICISMGHIVQKQGEKVYRVKSFYDDDEKKLLADFNNTLSNFCNKVPCRICAHNGNEFDIPYIARRSLILGLKLPKMLDIAGLKPWELKDRFIDTMQLWKFGDFKSFTSLSLLCAVFNIPTPKDDIDGSQVAEVYYKENDLDRIIKYCEKDTLAVANLLLRFQGKDIIDPDTMEIVP